MQHRGHPDQKTDKWKAGTGAGKGTFDECPQDRATPLSLDVGAFLARPALSTLVAGRLGPFAHDSEFNRRLDVKQSNVFGLEPLEQASALFFGNRQADLGGLIAHLEKMRGMQFPGMPEAFDTGCQSGPVQTHFLCQINEPVTEHFSVMTAVLLSKENHQKTLHDGSPLQ
ncbi:hypothetical protein QFZ84_001004 [Pseudomonas fluorescens]